MIRGHLIVLLLGSSMLAPVAAQAADASDKTTSVEEIIVTAQRRAEHLEDVPISVSAFTPERMDSAGIAKITDLGRVTPGLRFDQTSVFVQPTIRGIGSTTTSAGAESNVAIYVDGFYLPFALGNVFDLADVNSVQVLKGPQGTLFGRNATGGAILITTKAPSLDRFGGNAKVSYGSYNDFKAQAFVTGPITDWLAASLSAYHRYTHGYVTNIYTGAKDNGEIDATTFRAKLLFQPTDAAKVTLTLEHADSNNPLGAVQTAYNGDARGAFTVPGTVVGQTFGQNSQDFKPLNRTIANAMYLRGEFKLGDLMFNSYSGYRAERARERADLDGSSAPITGAEWEQVSNTFTQEFTLAGQSLHNKLNWITGAYYFHNMSKDPFFRIGSTAARPPNITTSQIESDAYALFADGTYNLTDKLFLSLGGRWTTERKDFTRQPGGVPPEITHYKRWNSFTPRAVLRYEVEDHTSVYASFSQGFKSGAFNASSTQDVPVNPEKLTAYEVGVKTAQHRFRLDGAIYYYDYKDLQFTSYDYTRPGNPSSLRNAARLHTYGADLNGSLQVTDDVTATLGGAYTHAKYASFPGAGGFVKNPLGGWNAVPVDASGRNAIRTPRWTGNIGLAYKHSVGYGDIMLAGNFSYASRIYFDVENKFSWKPIGLLNANLSWSDPSKDWKVSVYGSNLTNVHYPMNFVPSTYVTVIDYAWPRTVGASIERKF